MCFICLSVFEVFDKVDLFDVFDVLFKSVLMLEMYWVDVDSL